MTGPAVRALGIDIGGTKIAAAVVGLDGTIFGRAQQPTPQSADADVVLAATCAAADAALAAAGGDVAGVGVATAGPIDASTGAVSPVNICAWRGFPLRERLAERYAQPIRLFGDGIAIAIAEHWLGAGRGADNMLGMVVSTGVGGGFVLGGRVLFGAGGNAGHIGHQSIDADGPHCACGGIGCLEALASGTSIAAWYAEHRNDGVPRSAADIAELARSGDELAGAAFHRSGSALGMALAGTVTLLDLDRVVIGGGVAHAWDLLNGPMEAAYRRFAALDFAAPRQGAPSRIVRAGLGADTGVLGAAAVVLHPDRYWY